MAMIAGRFTPTPAYLKKTKAGQTTAAGRMLNDRDHPRFPENVLSVERPAAALRAWRRRKVSG
jgi:hypothetical protein